MYKWPEHNFSSLFIGSQQWGEKWSEKLFFPPCPMCQHKSCFQKEKGQLKLRIKGSYQLNPDRQCEFFKKKWYLFWKKIK